jgi:hypothetical protein
MWWARTGHAGALPMTREIEPENKVDPGAILMVVSVQTDLHLNQLWETHFLVRFLHNSYHMH